MKKDQKVILIKGFTNEEIRELLSTYRSNTKLPKDVIFATVTETALSWTVKEWLEELEKEHEEFKKINK